MSKKEIPAEVTYVCDGCQRESKNPFDIKLTIVRTGRDYQGHPVGGATTIRDLCDACAIKLNEAFASLRERDNGG